MTHAELIFFCDPTGYWRYPNIDKPWAYDGFAYATDSRIIARVPSDPTESPILVPDGVPPAHRLEWWGRFPLPEGDAIAGVIIPAEPARVKCRDCRSWGGRKHCESCDKSGTVAPDESAVVVAGESFAPVYLRKLAAMPGLRSQVGRIKGLGALLFQSGELCGAVMAMHVWPKTGGAA